MPKLKINLGPKKPVEHAFFAVRYNPRLRELFLFIPFSRIWIEPPENAISDETKAVKRKRRKRRSITSLTATSLTQTVMLSS